MKKQFLLWLLAFLLTVVLAVYQRLTGPTYPVRGRVSVPEIRFDFYRSWTSHQPLPVSVVVGGSGVDFRLYYRRFPFIEGETWTMIPMEKGRFFSREAFIPGRPAAAKVAYKVEVLFRGGGSFWLNRGEFVVARFKDEIPDTLLILHIIFMFAGMLLAFRTCLEALRRDGRWQKFVPWPLAVTFIGGLVLGPLVQKLAFGSFWTGFPLGSDLTDSKTLFVVIFWLGAFLLRRKSRWWAIGATILMVVIYLIPHSVLGSEMDYKTGKVITAK